VSVCPTKIITMEPVSATTFVLCCNLEKGAVARKKCTHACIACTKCVRKCPEGAVVIEENLAKIDDAKCTDCGVCVEVCVTHCIQKRV